MQWDFTYKQYKLNKLWSEYVANECMRLLSMCWYIHISNYLIVFNFEYSDSVVCKFLRACQCDFELSILLGAAGRPILGTDLLNI